MTVTECKRRTDKTMNMKKTCWGRIVLSCCPSMIVGCFLLASCDAKMNENNDLAAENLRGPVSSVKVTSYVDVSEDDSGRPEWKDHEVEHQYFYSPEGMLLRDTRGTQLTHVHTYDADGRRQKSESINHWEDDLVVREDVYTYDTDGLKVKKESVLWGNPSERWTYTYDAQKRIVREEMYDYDKDACTEVVFHFYDDESPLAEPGEWDRITVCCYRDGKLVQKSEQQDGETPVIEDFTYAGGRLKKSVVQTDRSYSETAYGKSGETLASESKYALDESRFRHNEFVFKYRYDDKGNWIECLCKNTYYDDGLSKRKSLIKKVREIVYYGD